MTLHLTYPVANIDAERKKDREKEQAKEKTRKKANVRPDWSPEEHGLAAFFETHPLAEGRSIKVVAEGKPHPIALA